MKKLTILSLSIVSILVGLLVLIIKLQPNQKTDNQIVTIYNWGDYLDPALIDKFEKETGYYVRYETFDSNESMYTKLSQGGTSYDIAIPSDYMIQKLRKKHLLKKLDYKQIKGFDNLSPETLNQPFDPHNKYSIPYFFGTLGIIYNDRLLDDVQIEHWRDLWNPKLKKQIMVFDGVREVLSIALLKDGSSINSHSQKNLIAAGLQLEDLVPNIKGIVADEMKTYLVNEEAAVGVTFSGDAMNMMQQNKHLKYVVPSEGSNLWFDNIVIPTTVHNEKGAYAFINFMLRPENALQNAKYIGYATANEVAKKQLPKELQNNRSIYPTKDQFSHLKVYELLPKKILDEYYRIFLNFKMLNNK